MSNAILVIAPYYDETVGTWLFDDQPRDIEREPFVEGVPEMIDDLVSNISNARSGFRMLFAASPFPGFQRRLNRIREEMGGVWYATNDPPMEGWLCPVFFQFFDEAPANIFVKAEANSS